MMSRLALTFRTDTRHRRLLRGPSLLALICLPALAGCGARGETAVAAQAPATTGGAMQTGAPTAAHPLAGTAWRLVEFQSMDDAIGTVRPHDPTVYTMRLNADGTVAMRLICNRAHGKWSADGGGDSSSGGFEFGPLAVTRAHCPPPSLDERMAAHAAYIRSYLLKDGRLHLSLMADGDIYVWEPFDDTASQPPAGPG